MQIKKLIHKIELNARPKANQPANGEVANILQKWEIALVASCLVIASAILAYCTAGGLIWTSDSFHYWAASRSLIQEGIFLSHGGTSYVYWPPLFPIILSLFSESSYHLVQFIGLNMSLLAIYLYFRQLKDKRTAIGSLFLFTVSVFPYLVSSFLWSETIFILLLYTGLLFFQKWQNFASFKSLSLAVFFLSLMCLQRNAGLFIMLAISIYCGYRFLKGKNYSLLIVHAFSIMLVVLPNLLWNITRLRKENYNVLEQNYLDNIFGVLSQGFQQISKLIMPLNLELAGVIVGFVLMLIAISKLQGLESFILIIYFISFSFLPSTHYGISDRFLSPVVPFFFLAISEILLSSLGKKKVRSWFLISFIGIVLIYNVARTIQNANRWHERSITNPKEAKIFF